MGDKLDAIFMGELHALTSKSLRAVVNGTGVHTDADQAIAA